MPNKNQAIEDNRFTLNFNRSSRNPAVSVQISDEFDWDRCLAKRSFQQVAMNNFREQSAAAGQEFHTRPMVVETHRLAVSTLADSTLIGSTVADSTMADSTVVDSTVVDSTSAD